MLRDSVRLRVTCLRDRSVHSRRPELFKDRSRLSVWQTLAAVQAMTIAPVRAMTITLVEADTIAPVQTMTITPVQAITIAPAKDINMQR